MSESDQKVRSVGLNKKNLNGVKATCGDLQLLEVFLMRYLMKPKF